ncbi:MAG: flavodoxin-dependent (E)-4-hydroxy-3-methylbut-2-enyl-diphosphate synthase, partial [Bacteroidota bacterium]
MYRSQQIEIGKLTLGGDAPVRLQSMTSTDTLDVKSSVAQVL